MALWCLPPYEQYCSVWDNVICFNTACWSADFDGDGLYRHGESHRLIVVTLYKDTFGSQSRVLEKYEAKYDLDGNGEIGVPDFLIFIDFFGKTNDEGISRSRDVIEMAAV